MGILELLTIIFILLKAFGVITWSWWLVFLPSIISVSIYVIWFVAIVIAGRKGYKSIKEFDKKFFD